LNFKSKPFFEHFSLVGTIIDGIAVISDRLGMNTLHAVNEGAGSLVLPVPLLVTNVAATFIVGLKAW
jgi:hypothetical protein